MATIRAMTQQMNMLYKISPQGLSVGSLSNRLGTVSQGLSSPYQANQNYNYVSAYFGGGDSFGSLMSSYTSTRKQFSNEYTSTMSNLGKATSNLKAAGANAGTAATKATEDARSALGSLQSYANRQTGVSAAARREVAGALSSLSRFAAGYRSADSKTKQTALDSVRTIQSFLDQRTGVTAETARKAGDAVSTLERLTDDPTAIAEKASAGKESTSALRTFLTNYANAGEPPRKNAQEAVRFLESVAAGAESTNAAVGMLSSFSQQYSGADNETRTAALTAANFAREVNPADEATVKGATDALSAVQALIDKHSANEAVSDEELGSAIASLDAVDDFLSRYDGVVAHAATAAEARDALNAVQAASDEARSVYAPLDTIRNLADEDSEANTGAKESDREILGTVQEFVDSYNASLKFLSENRDVSSRVASLADSFGSLRSLNQSLDAIGIQADSKGTLAIDADRFTQALREKPDTVSQTLDTLAGRAERNMNLADTQQNRLFPSISSMMGLNSMDSAKSMYSGRAMAVQMNYSNVGTLLNLYF